MEHTSALPPREPDPLPAPAPASDDSGLEALPLPVPSETVTVTPAASAGWAPLTVRQDELWALDGRRDEISLGVSFVAEITSECDRATVREAFAAIAQRHPCLRTEFRSLAAPEGSPVDAPRVCEQHVREIALLDYSEADVSHLSHSAFVRALEEESRRAVSLPGAHLRVRLFVRAGSAPTLYVWASALVADEWSLAVILEDFCVAYKSGGSIRHLPELSLSYLEHAERLSNATRTEVTRTIEFWENHLSGFGDALDIPVKKPPSALAVETDADSRYSAGRVPFELPRALRRKLESSAKAVGTSVHTILLAAWEVLLFRYTSRDRFICGMSVTGRALAAADIAVGPFSSMLLVPCEMGGNPLFSQLASLMSDQLGEIMAHQGIPLTRLVRMVPALAAERGLEAQFVHRSGDAFRQDGGMLFLLPNTAPGTEVEAGGLTFRSIDACIRRSALAEIKLELFEFKDQLLGCFAFRSTHYEEEAVARMARHYLELLASIGDDVNRNISAFRLMDDAELSLIQSWCTLPFTFPEDKCVHDLFAQVVAEHPAQVAVEEGAETLSFAALDVASNRVANLLVGAGIVPGELVAILLPRCLQIPVAALGVVKAGAAYMPIDPGYPASRVQFMLEDSKSRVLLTSTRVDASLVQAAPASTRVVYLDTDPDGAVASCAATNPNVTVPSESLLCVIYTSGSTGKPKGVELHHKGFVNYVLWHLKTYGMGAGDRCAMLASPAFDAGASELWSSLCGGLTLVAVDDNSRVLPEALVKWLCDAHICICFMPTPLAERVLKLPWPASAALRVLYTGGDRLHKGASGPVPFRLVNIYGPTETTVNVTYCDVPPGQDNPPIGGAWANALLLVLSADKSLVPVGVPGELYIGGVGVARGYFGRADLTQQRFLNAYAHFEYTTGRVTLGGRTYRTGDLVRWRPDGTLEFIARMDGQVKIRGYRVELGEIEVALAEHPTVSEACCVVESDPRNNEKRIVAYVVPLQGGDISVRQLRDHAKVRLPEYMVPYVIMKIRAMPLTGTGKINRMGLPKVNWQDSRVLDRTLIAPRDKTEQALADIFADVLGLDAMSITDNFFELGGHSLSAAQVVTRVKDRFGFDMSYDALFREPTVARLAAYVARRQAAGTVAEDALPAARSAGSVAQGLQGGWGASTESPTGSLSVACSYLNLPVERRPGTVHAMSMNQQSLWYLSNIDGDSQSSVAYNILFAVRLSTRSGDKVDVVALRKSFEMLLRRHPVLRTVYRADHDGQPVQRVDEKARLDMELLNGRTWSDEELEAYLHRETHKPFDLANGPIMRLRLVDTAGGIVLVWTAHHIAVDLWSYSILFDELSVMYDHFRLGGPGDIAELQELATTYADFSNWQRTLMTGNHGAKLLHYWTRRLADCPRFLNLPTDHTRPSVQGYTGKTMFFRVPPEVWATVSSIGKSEGMTSFVVLIGCYFVLMHRYSGQDDIVIGTPMACRRKREFEDVVGYFVNSVPIRASLAGNPSFSNFLKRLQRVVLSALAHQDCPFPEVVRAVEQGRDASHHPIFQSMFVLETSQKVSERQLAPILLGEGGQRMELGSLVLESMKIEKTTAQMDVTMLMAENDEGGLLGCFQYNSELFEPSTIDGMAEHFVALLSNVASQCDAKISDLTLISPRELGMITGEWTATTAPYDETQPIHSVVENVCTMHPRLIAVAAEDVDEGRRITMTYADLSLNSNRIANLLMRNGVGSGEVVAVLLPRCAYIPMATLGVIKTGAAYMPIDPSYPAARVQFMLEDSKSRVVLTISRVDRALLATVPPSVKVVFLDTDPGRAVEMAPGNLPTVPVSIDALLCVIYTSGSTGKPKGVQLTHRNFANYVAWHVKTYGMRLGDRCSMLASPAFDGAASELWSSLCTGMMLIAVDENSRVVPEALVKWLIAQRVNICFMPTPLAERVLKIPWPKTAPLRVLYTGGDRLHKGASEPVPFRLVNIYGPTEATVNVTYCEVPPGQDNPPVGGPVANVRLYVLDRSRRPVPVGITGELYVAGVCLSRGYYGRDDLTQAAFMTIDIPVDPSGRVVTERVYKTGDFVRWRADGKLDFVSRIDNQIKLRGFRVELGEIESVMEECPLVAECVVVPVDDPKGEKRLVGYFVPRFARPPVSPAAATSNSAGVASPPDAASGMPSVLPAAEEAQEQLRVYLQEKMPEYMVPSFLVAMSALPLSGNGKVDKRALPAVDWNKIGASVYEEPKTPVQKSLAAIFAEVLAVDRVGLSDDFFELGGHSLLIAQVISRVRSIFGVELGYKAVFQSRTVALLAEKIEHFLRSLGPEATVVSLHATPGSSVKTSAVSSTPRAQQGQPAQQAQASQPAATPTRGRNGSFAGDMFDRVPVAEQLQPPQSSKLSRMLAGDKAPSSASPSSAVPVQLQRRMSAQGSALTAHQMYQQSIAPPQLAPTSTIPEGVAASLSRDASQSHVVRLFGGSVSSSGQEGAASGGISYSVAGLGERMSVDSRTLAQAVPAGGSYPLSYNQRSLWFVYKLQSPEEQASYHVISGRIFLEELDETRALEAVRAIVRRNQQLRAYFGEDDGVPYQRVSTSLSVDFAVSDAMDVPDAALKTIVHADVHKPFFVSSPERPLLRVRMYRRPAKRTLVVFVGPHICLDGWSLDILWDEFNVAYIDGGAALAPKPMQYADFVHWQTKLMDGEDGKRLQRFWKRSLANVTVLNMPSDKPRPPVQTYNGAAIAVEIPAALADRLRAVAAAEQVTMFPLLLSAFFAMMYRYTAQEDIAIGFPVAGRSMLEFERIIGHFANVLVLRTRVSAAVAFSSLLADVQEALIDALSNQDMPFASLVEAMQTHRDPSRSPLAQALFALQRRHRYVAKSRPERELLCESYEVEQEGSPLDLSLIVEDDATNTVRCISLRYNTDLFTVQFAQSMCAHYLRVLESVCADPLRTVGALQILAPAEHRRIVVEWNDTALPGVPTETVAAIVERHARERPAALALASRTGRLTYAEMDRRSSCIARYVLASMSDQWRVGPQCVVAVFLKRSLDLLVSALAAHKAGAAYLFIDPKLPAKRVEFQLTNAAVPVVVTHSELLPLLPPGNFVTVLVDKPIPPVHDGPGGPVAGAPVRGLTDLAYVVYTSGSTGTPKGVCIEHRNLLNMVTWAIREYNFGTGDVGAQMIGQSFDPINMEVWPLLVAGGGLYIIDDDERLSSSSTVRAFAAGNVTFAIAPTAMAEYILEELPSETSMRTLVAGGEKMQRGLNAPRPSLRYDNLYGPAECTVLSTYYRVGVESEPPPIGKPIGNARVYVLDPQRSPVPVSIPGELYIAGAGVGRGYLGRNDLTARAFVDVEIVVDAASKRIVKERLYKTGDLVRWRRDGNLEFLGRADNQIKLRGFRIELDEIETVVCKHPAVAECVVLVREEPATKDKRLVGYYVCKGGASLTTEALRSFILESLPEYMLPSALIALDEFPLTPNGKVDRQALPEPDWAAVAGSRGAGRELLAPRTELEQRVADLFGEILGSKQFGILDSFFALGGHSLAASRLVARLKKMLGVEIPVSVLYEQATVAGLAESLATRAPALKKLHEVPGGVRTGESLAQQMLARMLKEDSTLDAALVVAHGAAARPLDSNQCRLLLTGASGFVGAFLLKELLLRTEAQVYCIVRCKDEADGMAKLRANMSGYGLLTPEVDAMVEQRVFSLPGDLAKPQLGVLSATYKSLCETIDAVVHNGSLVNFLLPYEGPMRDSNALGTAAVVRLCMTTRAKPLHYVSTMSVFPASTRNKVESFAEERLHDAVERLGSGYAKSKWVAEKLVAQASERGLPVAVYRLGRVMGSVETGACSTLDFLYAFLKGCLQIRAFPDLNWLVDPVPVDFVASAIATVMALGSARMRREDGQPLTLHLRAPSHLALSQFVAMVKATEPSYQTNIAQLPYGEWRARLLAAIEAPLTEGSAGAAEDNALRLFSPLFTAELEELVDSDIACERTVRLLTTLGARFPAVDQQLVNTYVQWLWKVGFFPRTIA